MTDVVTTATLDRWPLSRFRPDERELARHDDEAALRRLADDLLANGQLQAVGATEDGRLIFGHARLLAARLPPLDALDVRVFPAGLSDTRFHLVRAAENLQRRALSGYRQWLACTDLLCGNPDWRLQDLAARMHLTPSAVTRIVSPSKCSPDWQAALQDGRVGISDCYAASKLDSKGQAALLALKLGGATRDALERAGRTTRASAKSAGPRLTRVRCPLPDGRAVVVSGQAMTITDLADALSQALDLVRRAGRESLDIKTAARVWADKSRAVAS